MAGSVFKRENSPCWYISYDDPNAPDGKRRQIRKACRHDDGKPMTKREAEAELARVQADISRGKYRSRTSITLEDHLKTWLQRQTTRLSPSTIEAYGININRHIVPALGHHVLQKLRPVHIQYFYDDLAAKLSAKTISNIHGVLHCALDQAMRLDLILSNPADRVDTPKTVKPHITIATETELARLQAAIGDSKYRMCILLALCAGLRRGETVALKWEDINMETRALNVCRAAIKVTGRLIVKGTKSGRERIVVLPPSMMLELQQHKATQDERIAKLGALYRNEGWISANLDGTMFSPKGLAKAFSRLQETTRIGVTLHGLRHTYVTEQLVAGVPSETVQKMAGHATIAFMHDRYGHAQPRHQDAAVEVSEKLLHPKSPIEIVG